MEKERENLASGSPGINPVKLSDCIEQLLQFILQAFINGTLDFDLSLSTNFCATLLNPNPDHHVLQFQSETSPISSGLPLYPLYKCLASALHQCITSGSFISVFETVPAMSEDESLKELKEEWNEIGSGDLLFFNKCLMLEVQDVRRHESFSKMLEAESLEKVLPGEQIYRNFYSREKEQSNGVVAICVSKPASQPYSVLSDIIVGLGYKGIQSLLGLKHTIGTTPEALPPPRSTLLSSFMLPQNPDANYFPFWFEVKGCSLTDGARALSKHVNRCSSQYWGKLEGNDLTKNQLAMKVITNILDHCIWLNVHIIRPHGAVFELRVPEGYGARWSSDGTKFIGFLEPYMEDGHSKKWRH
ncbi:hypothetical protein KSS87_019729 [Heliosperma pusillum]|nr:hypothetical protein KSS87_019729 [Heliosperma pusillum]